MTQHPRRSAIVGATGAGAAAMEELRESTRIALVGEAFEPRVLRHRYANLFSHDAAIDAVTGSNDEEPVVGRELRKIMSLADLLNSVTCIRVRVLRTHAITLTAEFERPVTANAAREALTAAPGVWVVDDRLKNHFPMPIQASGQGDVLVGPAHGDTSDFSGHSLSFVVAGDRLMKGAALNAVQIVEKLLRDEERPLDALAL